jgi:hypothetical protein
VKDLIPVAVLLLDLTGGYDDAERFLVGAMQHGRRGLDSIGIQGDRRLLVERKMTEANLFASDGGPVQVRLAELTVLLDVLKAVPPRPSPPPAEVPLLFTLPVAAGELVGPGDRIDRRINDLIARSQRSLTIGGPFWNEAGFALLRPVLLPALRRGVRASFFAHPQGPDRDGLLTAFIGECRHEGDVELAWWRNGAPSLMHAKFVIADTSAGYLGTANLTSLGMEMHLEVGVPLSLAQCRSLEDVLAALMELGLFERTL